MTRSLSVRTIVSTVSLTGGSPGTFTSKASGQWNSPNQTTWNEAGYPGPGATVVINDGNTVTVMADQTVGASGNSDSTSAILINGTGQIIINSGVTFTVEGDVLASATGLSGNYVTMNAGSHWIWQVPPGQYYRAGGSNNFVTSGFAMNGTSDSRASMTVMGGGGAMITPANIAGNGGYGGSFIAGYADISNLGDSTHNALWLQYTETGVADVIYNVQHCTFTRCGRISDDLYQWGPNGTCVHKYNVHINSADPNTAFQMDFDVALGTGTREISYNVFDLGVGNLDGNASMSVAGFTIKENYFGGILNTPVQSLPWAQFDTNLMVAAVMGFTVPYTVNNSYFYVAGGQANDNPHVFAVSDANGDFDVTSNIFQTNSPYGGQGDLLLNNSDFATASTTHRIEYNLALPSIAGDSSGALLSWLGGDPYSQFVFEHNTAATGGETPVNFEGPGPFEGSVGHFVSYRNNLIYALPGATSYQGMLRYVAYPAGAIPTTDLANPANVDYNDGYNIVATNGDPNLINQGKGYAASWSVTPGAHDLAVAPNFKDPTRNIQTFGSAYLGNTALAWESEQSYELGDIVSNTFTGSFNNSSVLYRCIAAHTSDQTNIPGDNSITTNYTTYWEDASLYYIRQSIGSGSTYTGFGITDGTVLDILMAWVRDGFSPTNGALQNAGSDGKDIGAVAYQTSTAGTYTVSITPSLLMFVTPSPNSAPVAQSVTITNTGDQLATISSVTLSGNNPGDFALTDSCTVIQPSASCVILITFSPTASGVRSATLVISDNASNSPQSIPLAGTGIPTAASAIYGGQNTTTMGNWTSKYGINGFIIANDVNEAPSYATVTLAGENSWTWSSHPKDRRALRVSEFSFDRIASAYYSTDPFSINVNLTDGNTYTITLYLLDWDSAARAEKISILDAGSNAILDTEYFANFHNGEYASWNITGDVIIQVIDEAGFNGVVSGIFFDPPSGISTQGSGQHPLDSSLHHHTDRRIRTLFTGK